MVDTPALNKNNKTCAILNNGEFVLFEPLFGYAQYVPLPDSKRKIVDIVDLTSRDLGQNVREVLANSRVLDISEIDDFFDDAKIEHNVFNSEQRIIELVNKKNKTAFYKNMMQVPTSIDDGIISFRPTKHERSDCYAGLSPGSGPEIVKIDSKLSDEDIGEALKLAFSRCTGVGAYEFHQRLKAVGWES